MSILKTSCVIGGQFIPKECKTIATRDLQRAKLNPRRDSIVFSRMNTPALVGECGYVDSDYPNLFLPDRLWMTGRGSRTQHSVRWLAYLLSSWSISRVIKESATGTSGSMKNISKGSLLAVRIPLPPTIAEQEAIAGALNDADALIESLEQLIAKKRQIKQGALQKLLTGKRRLPGFTNHKGFKRCQLGSTPNDWDCIQLPSLTAHGPSSIKIGPFGSALKKGYLTKEGFKVYGQVNVYERNMDTGDRFINGEHFRKLRSCEIRTGDFLISMMGTVGKCMIVPPGITKGIMDSHLLRLRLDPGKLSSTFLAQLFETRIVSDQVKQLSVGGIMEGLSSKIIKSLNLPVPPVEEQIAIAEALSDMDAEIAALKGSLVKTRNIKHGMMQELLTGRIRLV